MCLPALKIMAFERGTTTSLLNIMQKKLGEHLYLPALKGFSSERDHAPKSMILEKEFSQ